MKNFWNFLHENFKLQTIGYCSLFISFSLLLSFQGCIKESSTINLAPDDLLNAVYTDSVSLVAYSVLEDTLNTRNLQSNFLGFLEDPVFGTTTTGVFTQFIPAGNSVNFGTSPQLDSIVLTLRYAGGFYGDTLNPFAIKVFRLDEDILSEEPYYQNKRFTYFPDNLTYNSDFRLYPKPKSKVKLDTIVEAHARIRLSDELGNLLLHSTEEMASNESFKKFFKGLYICAEPLANNGSLVNFNLISSISGIHLYYSNDTVHTHFQFYIKSNVTVRVAAYEHDYKTGSSEFVNQIISKDTLLGKEMLYVQSMGGIKTKISFPHIKAFKNRNIVINKAELVITNIGEELSLFKPPQKLSIRGVDSKGSLVSIPDASTMYWGGNYDETAKEYRFRITKYIQNIILKDDFSPFIYLVTDKAAADASRLIINGTHPANLTKRLRLELYYTEY